MEPAGRLKRIAAAVVVDDASEVTGEGAQAKTTRRKRTPEEMKNIEQLAAAAIGLDATRGDVLAVENLTFQQATIETPSRASKLVQVRTVLVQWSSLLRYAGIAALFFVVYFTFLRPIQEAAANGISGIAGPNRHVESRCWRITLPYLAATVC